MSCNPCADLPVNSSANETLASQIENFTKQFFGSISKTTVNGVVVWELPCDLDIGLENNARAADEGLACYFLRLFREGIVGLTGPQGGTGASGTNGTSAFTATVASFTQPTLGAPIVVVRTFFNPAILADLHLFIQGSGWYLVNSADANGFLNLTLTRAVTGASGTITAGKLVIPAGYPGVSITGPQGPIGPQGPAGPIGVAPTGTNGDFDISSGTDYPLTTVATQVNFVSAPAQVLLPETGMYLLTAVIALEGLAGIALNDVATLKLRDVSNSADVSGSLQQINNLVVNQKVQLIINSRYQTDGPNKTVSIYGDCTTSGRVNVMFDRTTITYVRVA